MSVSRFILPLVLLSAASTAASAQYCALYADGTRSCGIPSFQSCLESIRGIGGNCQQDYASHIPPNFIQRQQSSRGARSPQPEPSSGITIRGMSPCISIMGNDPCLR